MQGSDPTPGADKVEREPRPRSARHRSEFSTKPLPAASDTRSSDYTVLPDRVIHARSDDLARVQDHLRRNPEIRAISIPFEHLPLVIDTNRVLQDLAWIAKRKNPDVRNWLQELCASGFATLYAPEQLIGEVETHLAILAENVGVPRAALEAAWANYVSLINFIPTEHLELPDAESGARDPSDLPFLAAQKAVGAHGILSKDKDIAAMGALVVKHEALRFAVEFARNQSVVVGGTVLGSGTLVLSGAVIYGAFKGAAAMFRGYRRLPGWLQVLIPLAVVGTAAFAIFHAPTRARIRGLVGRAKPWLNEVRERGGELLGQYLAEMQEADGKAKAALTLLREQVPPPSRKLALKQLAYRACVESKVPLSDAEIENRVLMQGYVSRSKDFRRYIRMVLRSDERLALTNAGWSLTKRAVLSGPVVAADQPA